MHPLGWLTKYFLVALGMGIATDQAINAVSEVGEPAKGLIFRWGRHNNKHDDGDA